jgi:hypothetical protein
MGLFGWNTNNLGRRLNIDSKAIPNKKSGMAIIIYICIKQSYCLSLSV